MPILEATARVPDVREVLRLFIFEDKVHFAKAAQVLRGGKTTERVKSETRLPLQSLDSGATNTTSSYEKSKKIRSKYDKTIVNTAFLKQWAETNMPLNFQQFTMMNQYATGSAKKSKKPISSISQYSIQSKQK
jgi:hypothetical protein